MSNEFIGNILGFSGRCSLRQTLVAVTIRVNMTRAVTTRVVTTRANMTLANMTLANTTREVITTIPAATFLTIPALISTYQSVLFVVTKYKHLI